MSFKASTAEEEKSWRDASELVNQLWTSWSRRFADKAPKEILAMIALRFAQAFVVNGATERETVATLHELEETLDRLLVDDVVGQK